MWPKNIKHIHLVTSHPQFPVIAFLLQSIKFCSDNFVKTLVFLNICPSMTPVQLNDQHAPQSPVNSFPKFVSNLVISIITNLDP